MKATSASWFFFVISFLDQFHRALFMLPVAGIGYRPSPKPLKAASVEARYHQSFKHRSHSCRCSLPKIPDWLTTALKMKSGKLITATVTALALWTEGGLAQSRPDRLPSGLELTYASREGLGEQNGVWVGMVRNGNAADTEMGGTNAPDRFNGGEGNDVLVGYAGDRSWRC
jgi:hypothetical protein